NIRRKAFKRYWTDSYVGSLLRNKAVTGEFQPHVMKMVPVNPSEPDGPMTLKRVPHGEPVKGYFPVIITEQQWHAVRQAVKGRGKELGRKGVGVANLFTGLFRDARDGEMLHLCYTGSSRKNNTRVLLSYGVRSGVSGTPRLPFPYDFVEQ